ncbi:MAG: TonB-dependent receptor [Acidobacteriota bacterium]
MRTQETGKASSLRKAMARGAIVAAALLLLPMLVGRMEAQVTSVVQGHISDTSGASMPKASIKITNENTGVSRTVLSADDGYYRIPDLLAGTYQIRVEHAGFKAIEQSGIEITAQSTTNLNFTLELGEVTEVVNVTAQEPQVEATTARISEVLGENQLKSLPTAGRGVFTLTAITPGITGKSEGSGTFCCDVFSNYSAPRITSGGNENKANYLLDGINLRYTEGSTWAAAFSPNPDAVTEVRVSTNPTSADSGTMSGPQVQIVTKGGTNEFHGTGHFTTQQDDFNAVPFGSRREDIPDSYTRLFGATFGGPIVKDRVFFFGAYEGLRERASSSYITLTETEAFKNFVVATRPNSVAAKLFTDFPPFRYPRSGFVDFDGDGIPEFGEVTVDKPARRTGKQFNGRIDYQSPSARDRIYGSYWFTRPEWVNNNVRNDFDGSLFNDINYVSVVYTRTFSPNVLNEARFGWTQTHYNNVRVGDVYHVPFLATDDGLVMGNGPWAKEDTPSNVPEFGDVVSINRGKHALKFGGTYRHSSWDLQSFLIGDSPEYYFASILDFADDNPYLEIRGLNVGTGTARESRLFFPQNELSLFVQNTWQIRPNLTLNYGVRWDSYFNNTLGKGRNNWQPVLTSDEVTPANVTKVINQKIERYYDTDKNNFGPRISLAWDPSGQGKMAVRGGFSILYDEVNTQPWYAAADNPPDVALVFAGTERGIPVVYGLAPVGTRDFPTNPNLKVPAVNSVGAFDGTRPGLGTIVSDLKNPMIFDTNVGIQYQVATDLMVHATYRFRKTVDDLYSFNANRFSGDLLDGSLDQLNPNFDNITLLTNLGRRRYNGLVAGVSKRMSQGWQLNASYTYNNGWNNFANGQADNYDSSGTNAYDPEVDWARDDIAHVFTLHSVWDLPILRGRTGWLGGILGGWQLNSIWNFQAGGLFVPLSYSGFGEGGDFNADGQRGERPDLPTSGVAQSFSKDEWLRGALGAGIFPLPTTVRAGTLPRDYFRGPGYARVDAALSKSFPVPIGAAENARLQVRAEAFNLLNRINLNGVENSLDAPNFGRATGAFQMRTMQLSVKFVF